MRAPATVWSGSLSPVGAHGGQSLEGPIRSVRLSFQQLRVRLREEATRSQSLLVRRKGAVPAAWSLCIWIRRARGSGDHSCLLRPQSRAPPPPAPPQRAVIKRFDCCRQLGPTLPICPLGPSTRMDGIPLRSTPHLPGAPAISTATRSQTESQSVSPESDPSCQLPLLCGCASVETEARRGDLVAQRCRDTSRTPALWPVALQVGCLRGVEGGKFAPRLSAGVTLGAHTWVAEAWPAPAGGDPPLGCVS